MNPPNLEGLSCRWHPIEARKGSILSVIILPQKQHDEAFTALTEQVLSIFQEEDNRGSPVPKEGPKYAFWSKGIDLESAKESDPEKKKSQKKWVRFVTIFAWCLAKFNINYNGFSAKHYAEVVSANTDFRKFDDGLKMTVDCNQSQFTRLEDLLTQEEELQRMWILRKLLDSMEDLQAIEFLVDRIKTTKTNDEFFQSMKKR